MNANPGSTNKSKHLTIRAFNLVLSGAGGLTSLEVAAWVGDNEACVHEAATGGTVNVDTHVSRKGFQPTQLQEMQHWCPLLQIEVGFSVGA
jgi:hypothetical protein